MSKMPALSALRRLGGRVGGSDRTGEKEKPDGFDEVGNRKRVNRHNQRGCALLRPFRSTRLQEPGPESGDVNGISD